jgi:rfaE bifunctional protein kinase chain/domain
VIADGQHLVRADRESKGGPNLDSSDRLIELLASSIGELDALVLQDYNKGTLSASVIGKVIELARKADVPTFVDPKRANFFSYQNVSLFKPNRTEVEDALGLPIDDPQGAIEAIARLRSRLEAEMIVVTLGEQGMVVESVEGEAVHVETRAIQVADVSGAGDTVISLLAAGTAAGADPVEAVLLANTGAGIVCEQVGTVGVTVDELRSGIGSAADRGATRLYSIDPEVE